MIVSLSFAVRNFLTYLLLPPLSLSVVQRSPRSDAPTCFLRLEHGSEVMCESGRVTCEAGEGVMEGGGVEGTLHCDPNRRETVDKLIQNPIVGQLSNSSTVTL